MKIIVKLELDVPLHNALKAEADADDSPVGYHIECVLAERQEYRRKVARADCTEDFDGAVSCEDCYEEAGSRHHESCKLDLPPTG